VSLNVGLLLDEICVDGQIWVSKVATYNLLLVQLAVSGLSLLNILHAVDSFGDVVEVSWRLLFNCALGIALTVFTFKPIIDIF
jgi:hypothetical protein